MKLPVQSSVESTAVLGVQGIFPVMIGRIDWDISLVHTLCNGKVTLIVEEEPSPFRAVIVIMAALVVFTYPPFPNVMVQALNSAAYNCTVDNYPVGSAMSEPINPLNDPVLKLGLPFRIFRITTVTFFTLKSLTLPNDPSKLTLFSVYPHVKIVGI